MAFDFTASFVLRAESIMRAHGFTLRAGTFVRERNGVLNLITVYRSGNKRRVELGVTFQFLLGAKGADTSRLTAADCEIKNYLPSGEDAWYASNEVEAKRAAIDLETALAFFSPFENLEKLFGPITPEWILSNGVPDVLKSVNGIRPVLVLARFNLDRKRFTLARRFAELGIAHSGAARALKGEFENIAREAEMHDSKT